MICHNDIHRGNVMRNRDGELDPEEVILVDFDAAEYGYRQGSPSFGLMSFGPNFGHLKILDKLERKRHDKNVGYFILLPKFRHWRQTV